MHRIEYVHIGEELRPYERDVERLRERTRAARQGYNLPPEELEPQPRKSGQEALGGFTVTPRDTIPADREPEPLPDCELSEIQLAEIRAREGKIVSVQGNNVIISDGDRRIQAYCHDVVHEGETVYYVTIFKNEFMQQYRILGRKGSDDK